MRATASSPACWWSGSRATTGRAAAAVRRLGELLPETEPALSAPGLRAVLVVCGCPARCAGVDGLTGPLVYVTGSEDVMPVAEKPARLLEGGKTDA